MVKTAKAGTPKLTLPVSSERDHAQGPDTAPVTLVEYGDMNVPIVDKPILNSKTYKSVLETSFVSYFAIFLLHKCILMPSIQRKLQRVPDHRINFGICTTTYMSTSRSLMISI